MQRRSWILLILVVALCAAIGGAISIRSWGTVEDETTIQPTPTPDAQESAARVVQQFVEALARHDADALYALQQDSYKEVCDRAAFDGVVNSLDIRPLEGPATIRLSADGNLGSASLYEVQPDGSRQPATIAVVRQPDGWRLAAPSDTGCQP